MSVEILSLCGAEEFARELESDARAGLTRTPKSLPPKYFYDARGSQLFEEITRLPEYYLTRAETSILERVAGEIVALARPREIVEIGAGFSRKTQLLLDALGTSGGKRFVPIDVSSDALEAAGARLTARYPWLEFLGVVGDFERHLAAIPRSGARLVCFLGSTIGNLETEARVPFLKSVRAMLEGQDRFLLGVDLVKSPARLFAAYNDARGITADFNKNVLHVLDRELGGDLDPEAFAHRAFYDPRHERIEMRLVALQRVEARLAKLELELVFDPGDELHTEISCKFRRETVAEAFRGAGLVLERWITDEPGDFALALGRLS
ncbi:MAG: L-histidine N(alpha)-methyltransferase [Planctomycetes bacterium]|nr:L-histidine N(alpha)-methyltransferase [Planctomycetota bacterium]